MKHNGTDITAAYHNGEEITAIMLNGVDVGAFTKPPVTQSATTNTAGTVITLTFDKPMADPTGKHAEFEATIAGSARSISSAALNADTTKINLTLSGAAIANGNTVSISYTKGTIESADGGKLESFSGQLVTNAVPNPYQEWEYHTDSPVLTVDYPYQVVIKQSGGAHGLLVAQGFIYAGSTYMRSVGASRYYSAWSNGGAWSLAMSWAPNEDTYMSRNLNQFTEVEANENVRSGDKSSTWFAKTTP